MNQYRISCPIIGYLPRIPHEDGELNEAMLQAFDEADCGVLHDIDMTEELWQVKGSYTFTVNANSESEALSKAQEVFDELWESGKVDCGDLQNTDRSVYENGDEYRCCEEMKGETNNE